ncbi:MAG TPA: hypothetical protein VFJ19_04865 [Nocardioidaceae bacterium]|nr:hypothetical protein [Nocardioidaceae bacterium]
MGSGRVSAELVLLGEQPGDRASTRHRAGCTSPPVLPTSHPSAVLRAQDRRHEAYQALVDDLRVAADALG